MKRNMLIVIIFSCIFAVMLIGCGESNIRVCNGICDNSCISIPNVIAQACDCIGCEEANHEAYEVDKENYKVESLKIIPNSDGIGKNGYIVVGINVVMSEDFDPFGSFHHISYTVDAYDNGQFVGSSTISRIGSELSDIYNITDYFIINIETFITGNYTLELSHIELYYA